MPSSDLPFRTEEVFPAKLPPRPPSSRTKQFILNVWERLKNLEVWGAIVLAIVVVALIAVLATLGAKGMLTGHPTAQTPTTRPGTVYVTQTVNTTVTGSPITIPVTQMQSTVVVTMTASASQTAASLLPLL
ncbi:hypothetical protein BDV96DRAFT_651996 [Lophiotrema nucula]|uniref:Uncharacterized protein n=1 Tax=Lophiotrema nucula TaxID=690887 RepID=A0A6A5YU00_9PLEO|nr:hypothetical protein BDV96DRAFT_651996 [Lophiotrema nucula]